MVMGPTPPGTGVIADQHGRQPDGLAALLQRSNPDGHTAVDHSGDLRPRQDACRHAARIGTGAATPGYRVRSTSRIIEITVATALML